MTEYHDFPPELIPALRENTRQFLEAVAAANKPANHRNDPAWSDVEAVAPGDVMNVCRERGDG
jgi:hypothetical protein